MAHLTSIYSLRFQKSLKGDKNYVLVPIISSFRFRPFFQNAISFGNSEPKPVQIYADEQHAMYDILTVICLRMSFLSAFCSAIVVTPKILSGAIEYIESARVALAMASMFCTLHFVTF